MFVRKLFTEDWAEPTHFQHMVEDPSLEDIEAALQTLDGERHTLVILQVTDEHHMAVGGGNNGMYTVYVTFDGDTFFNLINDTPSSDMVRLVAGGQEADYPGRECVSLEDVMKAAKFFAQFDRLNPDMHWENSKG